VTQQDQNYLRKSIRILEETLARATKGLQHYRRHGNAVVAGTRLASVALVAFGWLRRDTLETNVKDAVDVVGRVCNDKIALTRQGLMKALRTCGDDLTALIRGSFVTLIQGLAGYWSQDGKVNIAVDGTKFKAPRTLPNQAAFAAASTTKRKRKKKKYRRAADESKASTVQVLVTVFYHLWAGLPLAWFSAPSNGSERKTAENAVNSLPRNARIIADAEYVGYPLWSTIINLGRSFLVRVGSNVRLLKSLKNARRSDGVVHYWPDERRRDGKPPLVLRLFKIRTKRSIMYVVTNELTMSAATARDLYKMRWKIEMFFRTVKQTYEAAELRCSTPENVLIELDWTLLGIWHMLYTAKNEARKAGRPLDQVSPALVQQALVETIEVIRVYARRVPLLVDRLAAALLRDESHRTSAKAIRAQPRKKQQAAARPPVIIIATALQRKEAAKHGK